MKNRFKGRLPLNAYFPGLAFNKLAGLIIFHVRQEPMVSQSKGYVSILPFYIGLLLGCAMDAATAEIQPSGFYGNHTMKGKMFFEYI